MDNQMVKYKPGLVDKLLALFLGTPERRSEKRLLKELAQLVELAQGHQEAGAEPGDEVFHKLLNRADGLITAHITEMGLIDDDGEIRLRCPQLRLLKSLAYPKPPDPHRFVRIGTGIALAGTAFTVFLGIQADVYHLITHWVCTHL